MNRITCYCLLSGVFWMCNTACKNQADQHEHTARKRATESLKITALKQQIEQHPDSVRLYDKIIDQYAIERNYKAAENWCDTLLQKDQERNFSYWFVKGDLQRKALQYDSAIISYQTYLQRFPDDDQILLNLANTEAEAGRRESLAISDALLKRFSTREMQADCYFIQGVYYSRVKQFDSAVKCFDQAILYRYAFWEAYIEKSIVYYDQKKYDNALAILNQLLQANPSYPDTYYWMGKCYEALNKKAEAFKNYEAAYSLDRTFIEAKEKRDSLSKQ